MSYNPPTSNDILIAELKYRYYKTIELLDKYLLLKNYRLYARLAGIENRILMEEIDEIIYEYELYSNDFSI